MTINLDQLNSRLLNLREARRGPARLLRAANHALRQRHLSERQPLRDALMRAATAGGAPVAQTLEALCVRERDEADRLFEEQQAKVAVESPAAPKALRARLETRRKAMMSAPPGVLPNFNFVILDTPALILPSSGIDMGAPHVEPWNNSAKVSGRWTSGADETLSFVFAWRNPSSAYVVINVESYLAMNGFNLAWASPSFYLGNFVGLDITAFLAVYEWWNQPPISPPTQASQNQRVDGTWATSVGPFDPGGTDSDFVNGLYDLSYRELVIPPQEVAVFEVGVDFWSYIQSDGWTAADFAGGDYQVMCPALVIAILT
jgi:hypothetical protein